MAPKRSAEKMEAEAAKLQRRAFLMQTKASQLFVHEVMRDRPDVVPSIVRHLKSLGIKDGKKRGRVASQSEDEDDDKPESAVEPQAAVSPPKKQKCRHSSSEGSVAGGAQASGSQDNEWQDAGKVEWRLVQDVTPRRYPTFQDIPPHYWRHILSTVEPISLSLG